MKKIILAIILITSSAQASFLSDYVSEIEQNLRPDYMVNQQRGYYTLGSYSSRVKNNKVNPISISPPSVSIGCSGIDIVGGGMSFLSKEELMDIYNQLTKPSTLAYIGFSIATKQLSVELAGTIETAMNAIQQINSMQIDGCGIANGIVNVATDSSYLTNQFEQTKQAVGSVKDKLQDSFNKGMKDKSPTSRENDIKTKIPNYSANEYLINGGSLIEYIYKKWGSTPPGDAYTFPGHTAVDKVRALYGDVYLDATAQLYIPIPPCGGNLEDIAGTYRQKDPSPTAECKAVSEEKILDYTNKNMDKFIEAYFGETTYDVPFVKMLQHTNIYLHIKNASAKNSAEYFKGVVNDLKPFASKEIAFVYVDKNFQQLIEELSKFSAEASKAADRGIALTFETNKLIESAKKSYYRFEKENKENINAENDYIIKKEELEKSKKTNNPGVQIFGGK